MKKRSVDMLDEAALPGEFAVYDHYLRQEDLENTARLLEEGGITVRRSTAGFGQWRENIIVGTALRPEYFLEIPENDFSRAGYLIREAAEQAWAGKQTISHPFIDYKNEELMSVIEREEDYGIEAAVVARNILLNRGVDLALQPIRDGLRARQQELAQPKELPRWQLLFVALIGVASGLVFQPIILLVAIGLSLHYLRGTTRLVNGQSHWRYGARTRVQSKWILALITLAFTVGLVNALYGDWFELNPVRTWWWLWR